MTLLEMFCLMAGFLGTFLGAAFFLAQVDKQSARKGLIMFIICAPMWYFSYTSVNAKYEAALKQGYQISEK